MSFQIALNKYERSYGELLRNIRNAIQATFAEEAESRGLTQKHISDELKVDKSVVSRRLNGSGNVTLRTVCDLYTAMDREPFSNFNCPAPRVVAVKTLDAPSFGNVAIVIFMTATPKSCGQLNDGVIGGYPTNIKNSFYCGYKDLRSCNPWQWQSFHGDEPYANEPYTIDSKECVHEQL